MASFYNWLNGIRGIGMDASLRKPTVATGYRHPDGKKCRAKDRKTCPFYKEDVAEAERLDDLSSASVSSSESVSTSATQNIPLAISNLTGMVAQREKKWRKASGLSAKEFAAVKANWAASVKSLIDHSLLGMKVPSESYNGVKVINEILKNGFRNLFETGDGGGVTDYESRADAENRLFGLSKNYDSPPPPKSERPKYGCLVPNTDDPLDALVSCPACYGLNYISLKKDRILPRATMTVGDSLNVAMFEDDDGKFCPSTLDNPSPTMIPGEFSPLVDDLKVGTLPLDKTPDDIASDTNQEYVEIQFHGDIGAEDIDTIYFEGNELEEAELDEEARAVIRRLGIKVFDRRHNRFVSI